MTRRRSRVGLGPAVATVALAGLLAGGFGILGGRPEASPAAGQAATGGAVLATPPAATPTGTPLATPWIECGPDPEGLPVLELQSGTGRTPGLVEVAAGPGLPATHALGDPFSSIRGPRVVVRPDVITELWIDGGACALEWSIEVIDVFTESNWVLHEAENPTADPNVAAQNRFDLSAGMGELRTIGQDVQLGGIFVFRTMVVRVSWRLLILPLEIPEPSFRAGRSLQDIPLVPGCDLTLTLGNRYTERLHPCDEDLSSWLEDLTQVEAGETLLVEFPGFEQFDVVVDCGHASGLAFEAEPEPGCWDERPSGPEFPAPDVAGIWTLALSACIGAGDVSNTLCGTWYARILVPRPVLD